jgi:predicted porin
MNKYSLSALAAAGLLAGGLVTSANAADLGGNCCADLEERVAELEATTARKGNRKVSLTISGWVAEQVLFWDDGVESNTYVQGLGTTIGTNVKFTGQATIVPGWSAGYVIHIEADGSENLLNTNANVDNGPSIYSGSTNYVHTLQSYWFIKSDHWGKVGVGLQSQASDNTAILVDGSGSLIPANFVAFDYGGFEARGSGESWFVLGGCTDCNGLPLNSVRYDTPTFAGFSASASWGEDDFWDVAIRYAGEFSGFKLAAAAAYSDTSNSADPTGAILGPDAIGVLADLSVGVQAADSEFIQVGAYLQHVPTGLFVYGAWGDLEVADDDANDFWYVKAGLRQRWTPLGHTVLYGEYEDMNNDAGNSEVELYGLGVVQEIDNAAMSMWLSYRHLEGEQVGTGPIEDFDYIKAGALINF